MESKIKIYQKEKDAHKSMVGCAYTALNKADYQSNKRDKHNLSFGDKWFDKGESIGYLTGYAGDYGSSGCTYQCTPRLARYLKTVINKRMEELVEEAIKLSAKDVEAKRIDAEDEAKSVLEVTTNK